MAAIIRIKRSEVTGNPGTLAAGELAYSALTGTQSNGGDRLYIGMGTEIDGDALNHYVVGGKYFTDMLDHVTGTLTASSALLVDANSKVDNFKVDNLDLDGNTISTTNTNGNLVLAPNGSGTVDVSSSRITSLATPTADTDAATKAYVDAQNEATVISVADSSGTSYDITLQDSDLSLKGDGYAISVDYRSADKSFVTTLNNSGVSAGSYGSQTAIPTFTVDATGRIISASTASVASSLTINGDGATSDTVSLLNSDLTFTGGTGVTATVTNNTVSIDVQNASTSAKGIASFSSDNFSVTSGAVTIKNGGVANAELANSTITLGSSTLTLGATTTDIAGLTSLTVDNISINGNTISSTDGSNTLYIDPAPTDSDGGDLIIRGNLTVQGTQTIINSTAVSVNDLNMVLADSAANAAAADGAGITIGGASYSGTKATFTYNGANDEWEMNKTLNLANSNSLEFGGINWKEVLEDHLTTNFFLAGEGIDLTYVDGANTLTIAAELATVTNPGVASFDSDQFTVTSGFATIYNLDGGTY